MKWNGGVHFEGGEDGCVGCWGGGRGLGEEGGRRGGVVGGERPAGEKGRGWSCGWGVGELGG